MAAARHAALLRPSSSSIRVRAVGRARAEGVASFTLLLQVKGAGELDPQAAARKYPLAPPPRAAEAVPGTTIFAGSFASAPPACTQHHRPT